ncbi:MAG TPA: hypothetical protein VEG38_20350, partial [Acidimicrobiia bacterium]|nr:hypothetical protein [Acidimicrobiia bacterium]
RVAFAEDKAVLEAIELNEQAYVGRRKARIAIDVAPTKMRRLLDRMIAGDAERVNRAPRVRALEPA